MPKVTITGASDDLIEVDGAIREEFNWYDEDDPAYLCFSDGTVLSVEYDNHGIWRVNRIVAGTAEYSKVEGSEVEDTFDVVTLEGDISWVVFGKQLAKADR